MTQNRTGKNIDAWCTKCKLVLAHTIEAIAENIIKRVMCNTCRGKHQFRAAAPGSNNSSSAAKKAASSKTSSQAKPKTSNFSKLISGKDLSKATDYALSKKFNIGELLSHKKFGVGVVLTEKDSNKIEVVFEEGAKILIHGRIISA